MKKGNIQLYTNKYSTKLTCCQVYNHLMFVVVCYDIHDDRRRSRVGKILEGYGTRVQRSVFECDLMPIHVKKLKERLGKAIKSEDSLRYYYLCAQCLPKVEVINGPQVKQAQLYFMV